MANYSSDAEMKKIDTDIDQWLGSRSDFSDVRDLVTQRINESVRRSGAWETLDALGVIAGGMIDKDKLLNPADLEDLENTWVREIIYFDNILSADDADPAFRKARELRRGRMRMTASLALHVDADGDGIAEEIIHAGGLRRG